MPTLDEDPDDLDAASENAAPSTDDDTDGGPFLARLVLESELLATGRAAPTGIHLTLWGPDCVGLDAWTVGQMWGWTEPELAAFERAGEQMILVLQTPGPRWGQARAELLANAILALRPDEAGSLTFDQLVAAIGTPASQAGAAGLRVAQRTLFEVFGIRDPLFGSGRIPAGDDPASGPPLFVDTQIDRTAVNGLLPGTCAFVDEYEDPPTLIRLPWPNGTAP